MLIYLKIEIIYFLKNDALFFIPLNKKNKHLFTSPLKFIILNVFSFFSVLTLK